MSNRRARRPHATLGLAGPALPGQIYPGGVALDTIAAIYGPYHYNCPPDDLANTTCTLFTLTPAPLGPETAPPPTAGPAAAETASPPGPTTPLRV
ncbi:MAG: hypothetical protein HY696_10020 [Deltaproteobacteria bacterium]|nr:hypothetical protein [Deltaproteobacteria bacterium]